jgi:glycosyltransferase involved in cell wall biosynthesis
MPEITVAIPTYEGASHIEDAVRSILRQEGAAFDLIVCDDRSTDDTLDRVRRLAGDRAAIEVNSERLGLAGNWNRCVARAQTPFVAVFHQDDMMQDGHLAAQIAAFGPSTGLVASTADVIDAAGRPVPPSVVEPGGCGPSDRRFAPGAFLPELAVSNPLRCSAVSLRVETHASLGGFDPSYRYVVDWDFWIKVAAGWEVAWIGRPTVSVRWHPASETHTFKAGTTDLEETDRLLSDLRTTHPELGSFRRPADRRLARAYLARAYEAARSGHPPLARHCLRRALSLHPAILAHVVADPRLAARLILGSIGRESEPGV